MEGTRFGPPAVFTNCRVVDVQAGTVLPRQHLYCRNGGIPHPVPARRAEGKSRSFLVLDPMKAPVVHRTFHRKVTGSLGYGEIAQRLDSDLERYPPPESTEPGTMKRHLTQAQLIRGRNRVTAALEIGAGTGGEDESLTARKKPSRTRTVRSARTTPSEAFDLTLDEEQERRTEKPYHKSIVVDLHYRGPLGTGEFTAETSAQLKSHWEAVHALSTCWCEQGR